MNKQRRKMTDAEIKEQEHFARLRFEKNPETKLSIMIRYAGGRCQAKLSSGERCPNEHGKPGTNINGIILLSPCFRPRKPFVHCQKCGFQAIKEKMELPIIGRRPSREKININQIALI